MCEKNETAGDFAHAVSVAITPSPAPLCAVFPVIAEKHIIIEKWYDAVLSRIQADEKDAIEKTDILNWFKENAGWYDNIRILKTKLEKAIFDELTDIFIASTE